MKDIFTICYSEEEANEVGHFIMEKGYEGVQNDSYRYCRESISAAFRDNNKHYIKHIYVGVSGCQYTCLLIEFHLCDINFHTEVDLLHAGQYEKVLETAKKW